MFVGHYAVGFLLKKKIKEIPLWLLFVGVQFVDIIAFTLVLLGIEKISYNPSTNPFLRTLIEYVPFTHSLLSNLIIAIVVALIFYKIKNKVWGLAIGAAVLSHWFIDFISHQPDLPLIANHFKVGLGLWNFPWLAFLIEIGLFVIAGYYLYKDLKKSRRTIILIILALMLYTPIMFAPEKETPVAVASITSLGLYAIFTFLAYWSERTKR